MNSVGRVLRLLSSNNSAPTRPSTHPAPSSTVHDPSLAAAAGISRGGPPMPSTSSAPAAALLVVAGKDTTAAVASVAATLGLACVAEHSVHAALMTLAREPQHPPIAAVVAALGTSPDTWLFDEAGNSALLAAARAAGVPACVYSHSACKRAGAQRMCTDAGAAGVVRDAPALQLLLSGLLQANHSSSSDEGAGSSSSGDGAGAPAAPGSIAGAQPPCPPPTLPPAVLVIASKDTSAAAASVAASLGLACVHERSMQAAVATLAHGRPDAAIRCVVSALGSSHETFLFDNDRRSGLLDAARAAAVPVVVYSKTACKHNALLCQCLDAGAAGVVDDAEALRRTLAATLRLGGGAARAQQPPVQTDQPELQQQQQQQPQQPEAYPPLQRRLLLVQRLRERNGSQDRLAHRVGKTNRHIQDAISGLPQLSRLAPTPAPGHVRFVVVSDTHNLHRSLALPAGEVLLHCGDLTGNYGRCGRCLPACAIDCTFMQDELAMQLLDVADWLRSLTQYKRIFVLPGNHDTLLDVDAYPQHAAARTAFLAALPPHATFLSPGAGGGGSTYRGLKLWGAPVVVSRVEFEGTRYYSDGFERTEAERRKVWAAVPEGLDVLMTHTPPTGHHADALLARALDGLHAPPRVHVFGHYHGGFGCGQAEFAVAAAAPAKEPRVWFNAAQRHLLDAEPGCGGSAWVFDLEATADD